MTRPFLLSISCCVLSILCGGLLLAAFGPQLPPWLMALTLALCSGLALACGFGLYNPRTPSWLRQQPVMGALCVALGVGAMFVPATFVVSAFLLGCGTRLVWHSACELESIEEGNRVHHQRVGGPCGPLIERENRLGLPGSGAPAPPARRNG